ncbi:50S ribosomal protein L22 [Candidatus Uabimicrobium amorphum]|uniref:Large ribosomal subunit protein uL22 n=1 Tax=Uabimicrobium amorphum TaxID=2596890 RepID=A0A5S9IPN1_UABAM|nr:50S ribosomal protein L22 [Candidatus Uabimicrobium amorphum]BBM85584.1 50S ribosomal protein L22 [Candidatus Uabimicrobium amorphum]
MKTYTATHKYARIAPRKSRYVMDMIRGKSVNEALRILQSSNRRAAPMIRKVLNSAIANANQDLGSVAALVIENARIDGGPTLKRFRPGPMGRAMRIRKRTSHITISLAEAQQEGE